MSGICGALRLDGRAAQAGELAAVLAALERRGPDGSRLVADGAMAMGCALLASTPESLVEEMPFVHRGTGCTITADIRLDNRAELIEAVGADAAAGDGELVLRAYLRWGSECLARLRGDFAFAIWDPRARRLFCARDRVGMRQFAYHHRPGRLFAFATEPRALLRHDDVPMRLNEVRLADFFENLEAADLESTFFEGLRRLPPAHALTVDAKGLELQRYWKLEAPAPLRLADDREYAEAFLEVFRRSVSARLRAPDPVGAMLSGGLDSGSVSAVAAHLLEQEGRPSLATFSALQDDTDCAESNAVRAALSIGHIDPVRVTPGDVPAMREELLALTRSAEEPFDASMALLRLMYLAAQRKGHKVVLDGGGGDMVLGANDMVIWHLRRGRIARAWREARGIERFWGPQPGAKTLFIRSLGRVCVPAPLRAVRRALSVPRRAAGETPTLLSPEFAARIDLPARRRANAAQVAGFGWQEDSDRARRMLHPYLVVGRERYDRVAAALAIEPRDPFCDQDLLEFCMSLPGEQFQDRGWPKVILRRATAGLLPDAVRWRAGKEHLGGLFVESLWSAADRHDGSSMDNLLPYISAQTIDATRAAATGRPAWDLAVAEWLAFRYASNWLGELDSQPG
ncbi:asparagine synthase-related protein [Erythrobacter sp. HL-111]|uniref:asparagine synthase-related protein n=1 Tax=Erythrobacter sp. HL-111 TaxID=1798193 RepID=UPI0006DAAC37|nr:asparagine synthase-related protein [Erythrobacter sp. HL-111]KPP94412.1 MAG: asparagine synthase (glutamine-hydrolysing) AsnB [Erythrobacteraceae bacterium HL-111]SDS55380.1 asparagine synthase (glutamine-hydrolysing) [Erythrobacter sp. HL-111]